jgi:hypothetical protein
MASGLAAVQINVDRFFTDVSGQSIGSIFSGQAFKKILLGLFETGRWN